MNVPLPLKAAGAEGQVLLWRFGWMWPLAGIAALAAVLVHLAAVVPARAALARAEAEVVQAARAQDLAPPVAAPTTEREQLQALQTVLRAGVEPTELILQLGEFARAEQIALAQGDYQQQFHASTQLLQLQVTQPVRASYPQLKRYIENVLRTMPNVSLDHISARRDNVSQAQLEVRLRWSFWIHAPQAARNGSGK